MDDFGELLVQLCRYDVVFDFSIRRDKYHYVELQMKDPQTTKFDEGNLMPVETDNGELVHKPKTDYRDLYFKVAKEAQETGCCAGCGEMLSEEFSPNIEAFEISGQILCDDCGASACSAVGKESAIKNWNRRTS